MTDTSQVKCIDSSVWLMYYFALSPTVRDLIDQESILITSSLSIFEIKKKLLSLKKDPAAFLAMIKQRASVRAPDAALAEVAAELAIAHKLGAMDALIYATAQLHACTLVTADNDFRGLDNVSLLS